LSHSWVFTEDREPSKKIRKTIAEKLKRASASRVKFSAITSNGVFLAMRIARELILES
jgi:pyrimidine operon attenuation protein/uracil phosphoribosyltransferase